MLILDGSGGRAAAPSRRLTISSRPFRALIRVDCKQQSQVKYSLIAIDRACRLDRPTDNQWDLDNGQREREYSTVVGSLFALFSVGEGGELSFIY